MLNSVVPALSDSDLEQRAHKGHLHANGISIASKPSSLKPAKTPAKQAMEKGNNQEFCGPSFFSWWVASRLHLMLIAFSSRDREAVRRGARWRCGGQAAHRWYRGRRSCPTQ